MTRINAIKIWKIVLVVCSIVFGFFWIFFVLFIANFLFSPSPGQQLGKSLFIAFLSILPSIFLTSIVATIPLLILINRLLSTKVLRKKLIWTIIIIIVISLINIWPFHSTEIKLFSIGVLPVPPEAGDSYYYYHGLGGDIMGISAVAPAFRFEWDKNLLPEEKLVRIQRSIQFYEDFAQKKSWDTYSYFRPYSLEEKEILNSCSELFEKIMKTKGQEAIIEAVSKNWGIIECRFKIRPESPSINDLLLSLDANGGNIFFWR